MPSTETRLPTAWLAQPEGLLPSNHPVQISAAPIAIGTTIAIFVMIIVTILFNLKDKEVFLEDRVINDGEPVPTPESPPSPDRGRERTRDLVKRKISLGSNKKLKPRLRISSPILVSPLPKAAINAIPIRQPPTQSRTPSTSPHFEPISPQLPPIYSQANSTARTNTTSQTASSQHTSWKGDDATLARSQAMSAVFPARSQMSGSSTRVDEGRYGYERYTYGNSALGSQMSGESYELASKTGLGDPY